jgi:hypothetical protein
MPPKRIEALVQASTVGLDSLMKELHLDSRFIETCKDKTSLAVAIENNQKIPEQLRIKNMIGIGVANQYAKDSLLILKEVKAFLDREKGNRKLEVELQELQTDSKIRELQVEIERLQTEKEIYTQERALGLKEMYAKVKVFEEAATAVEEGTSKLERMIQHGEKFCFHHATD